jgi:hypothetical protein
MLSCSAARRRADNFLLARLTHRYVVLVGDDAVLLGQEDALAFMALCNRARKHVGPLDERTLGAPPRR